jgi:F-type H+-transporting ATPase subunit b
MAAMGSLPLWLMPLAVEAVELEESAEEAGIGIQQILESNLINIVIILGLLIVLGRNVIGDILAKRRQEIEQQLRDAEKRKQEALEQLSDQQQKLAQAQQEAERIKQQAETNANKLREEILAQAEKDVEKLRATAERDLEAERDRAIQELRQYITQQALSRVEAELPQRLGSGQHTQLIDRSIQLLGGRK